MAGNSRQSRNDFARLFATGDRIEAEPGGVPGGGAGVTVE